MRWTVQRVDRETFPWRIVNEHGHTVTDMDTQDRCVQFIANQLHVWENRLQGPRFVNVVGNEVYYHDRITGQHILIVDFGQI